MYTDDDAYRALMRNLFSKNFSDKTRKSLWDVYQDYLEGLEEKEKKRTQQKTKPKQEEQKFELYPDVTPGTKLKTSSNFAPVKIDEPSFPAEKYLKDGRLVVFTEEGTPVYMLYLNKQFLPVCQQDVDANVTLDDIIAVYEYPTAKINELFWKGDPDESLLDHPVWKEDQQKLQSEIDKLEAKLAKLRDRQI